MTWCPGRVRLDRLGPAAITALARVAVAVHRQHVPVEHRTPTFSRLPPRQRTVAGRQRHRPYRLGGDVVRASRSRRRPRLCRLRHAAHDRGRRDLPRGVRPPRRAARPGPASGRFCSVSDILGFLPDPAHILAAVGTSRPTSRRRGPAGSGRPARMDPRLSANASNRRQVGAEAPILPTNHRLGDARICARGMFGSGSFAGTMLCYRMMARRDLERRGG